MVLTRQRISSLSLRQTPAIIGCSTRLLVLAITVVLASQVPALQAKAGAGWYLLKPPLREGITDEEILHQFPQWRGVSKRKLHEIAPLVMGDWNAPLSQWTHEGSFDSAAECQRRVSP